ncbi:hypothetical protein CMI44_00785 [Candidatus Pacearchaeota archaeon]|nr:hypothetical protein [Candidatus Pacearchaeota archaeon]|tara:strand:+ start:378 stop:932 length:555 start_codon:yes stop_codon:yes gene_type:complete
MFKINLSTKEGKTYKLEAEAPALIGKQLHDKINGKEISPNLEGYELEITGASDKAGFTAVANVEGVGLKKVLLTYGKAMKKRPRKEGKKKQLCKKPKGLRLRRTVRGKIISEAISQINLKFLKEGSKKLSEIFPEQNKKEEAKPEEKPAKKPKEEIKKSEAGPEQPKEPPKEKTQEQTSEEAKS